MKEIKHTLEGGDILEQLQQLRDVALEGDEQLRRQGHDIRGMSLQLEFSILDQIIGGLETYRDAVAFKQDVCDRQQQLLEEQQGLLQQQQRLLDIARRRYKWFVAYAALMLLWQGINVARDLGWLW